MAVIKRINLGKLHDAVAALTKREVLVGIPAENAARTPDPGEKRTINNAALGYIHEFGLPEKNIPARPFLVPGVEGVKDRLVAQMKKGAEKALTDGEGAVDATLHGVGMIGQNAVKDKIEEGNFAPLSPRTIAKRLEKAPSGEIKILQDTGKMRDAVVYVIRDKE